MTTPPRNPVIAPDHVLSLLDQLHRKSEEQEANLVRARFRELTASENLDSNGKPTPAAAVELQKLMVDKFIALDQDKSHFLYQFIRASGATNVVEAGTSYGVSSIYLALAVGQNKAAAGKQGVVIATEHEQNKADKARENWKECGRMVEDHIDLRVGDILQTLKINMPQQVDFLLLDIWTPLALPTLKLVQPHLRPGAVVFADNPISAAGGYKDFFAYTRDPKSGFSNLTLPFTNGFEMCVYLPRG